MNRPWRSRPRGPQPGPSVSVAGLLLLLCVQAGSCGKRGDPLPPLRRNPQPIADLRVVQRGERVEVTFVTPQTSVDGLRLPVLEVEVFRADAPGEFLEVARRKTLRAAPGEALAETEALPAPGTTLRFAVQTRVGRSASPSSAVVALTVQPPPPPPEEFEAALTPQGVALSWSEASIPQLLAAPPVGPPAAPGLAVAASPEVPSAAHEPPLPPEDTAVAPPTPDPGSAASEVPRPPEEATPALAAPPPAAAGPTGDMSPTGSGATEPEQKPAPSPKARPTPEPFAGGVWIYRRVAGQAWRSPLTPLPLRAASYLDTTVSPGEEPCYTARAVVSLNPLIESTDAPERCLSVRDLASPATPTGVAVLLEGATVEVSWSLSTEADLASYLVYRREEGGAWVLAGEAPAKQSAFREPLPAAGPVAYRVSARDQSGNESEPSAAVRLRRP